MKWFVYILECDDHSLYTGITTNLERRLHEHNNTQRGARYTSSRRPVKIVYSEIFENRSAASRREYEIKQLKSNEKWSIIQGQ